MVPSLVGGIVSGSISSIAIAPCMTIIDMSIIISQIHGKPLFTTLRQTGYDFITRNRPWNPSLSIMNKVYTSTYVTANVTESLCNHYGIDWRLPTTIATTSVNVVAIACKDSAYARLSRQHTLAFPKLSYGLFALRDGITILSSFVVKHTVAEYLYTEYGCSRPCAELTASLCVPMAAQIVSTPIHIYAIDIHRVATDTTASRLSTIQKCYYHVCLGRMLRIIPAFGVGGYLNDQMKHRLTQTFLKNE
jgi:hypothetical protein